MPRGRKAKVELNDFDDECMECIYRMNEESIPITQSSLEQFLESSISPGDDAMSQFGASVKRLKSEDLIDIKKREISLTRKGTQRAEGLVRRQRLAECAISDIFHIGLLEVESESREFKKAITPLLEARIMETLGEPSFSPFGYVIPGASQSSNVQPHKLTSSEEGQRVIISRIPSDNRSLLEYLLEKKATPGQSVTIDHIGETTGIISFQSGENKCVIAESIGELIWVYPDEMQDDTPSQVSESDIYDELSSSRPNGMGESRTMPFEDNRPTAVSP